MPTTDVIHVRPVLPTLPTLKALQSSKQPKEAGTAHFDGRLEAQRGDTAGPGSHSRKKYSCGLNPGGHIPEPMLVTTLGPYPGTATETHLPLPGLHVRWKT